MLILSDMSKCQMPLPGTEIDNDMSVILSSHAINTDYDGKMCKL